MSLFKARMEITRGQTTYVFEAQIENAGPKFVLDSLERSEAWVFDSPTRLSALDEAEKFRAAQPGDTVQMRTR